MKKIYLLVLFVFGFSAFAQQKGISYQAVIINPNATTAPGYNGTSTPLANKAICLSFKIVNSTDQVEYQESRSITTDGYGMVNVVIGTGRAGAGLVSTLEAVAWNQGNKKLVVGVNTDGVCSNYTEISNQVLNYTPYSFYAQNADIKDGYVTTAKLADGAVTDAKVAMGINPAKVGLGNVNNTSDANKPISTATQTALNLKANIASPTFTGTVSGIDKTMVGLSNVDNTTDANKPVSTAAQTALNLKANTTDVTTSLVLKEDVSNKSNASLGSSTTLYPTQNAVKTYVDSQISSATIVDADATTKGKIKLAGDLAGTADLPTVPGLALKADTSSLSPVATSGNYNDLTNKPSIPSSFALPTATASVLGGVKVGANLSIDANGVLNATAGNNVSSLTGVLPIANGGTGTTSIAGIKSVLGFNSSKVAIGDQAGQTNQADGGVGVGGGAGANNQGGSAVAIGYVAGYNNQGASSVAIGPNAAQSGQGSSAVAIGFAAGQNGQGANSVAIGSFAGVSQVANSIAINATGISTPLNPTNAGFYVAPVRNASQSNSLFYNTTTKEITYGTAAPSGPLNLATGVTGILPIANGGTGATTLTGLVKGNGTSALTAAVSGTDYQEPITLTTTGSGAATLTGNTLNIPSTTNYTLPTSSASVLGGVKVGTNLTIDGNGILSTTTSPTFTGTVTAPIYASTPQLLTAGATITWNPDNGLNASVTLDQNSTLSFTATPTAGSYGTLVVTQDATGGRTLTLPSTTNKVLGSTSTTTIALSSAANAKDILNFYYDGTNCYWNIGQGYGTAATAAITNLATSVSGTLPVANGGTGAATLTGLVKGNGTGAMTAATAGTDYLAPNGSAANLTNFPTLNQNTTGNAATATTATSATNVTGTVAVANGGTGGTTANAAFNALSPMTTTGDIVYRAANGNATRLGIGANATVLQVASGIPSWASISTGDLKFIYSNNNIGVGTATTLANASAGDNVAMGRNALGSYYTGGISGGFNIGIGTDAGDYNSSGSRNIYVGAQAGITNQTGSDNTFIGYNTASSIDRTTRNSISNSTAIGANAVVTTSNKIQLGDTNITNVATSGTVTAGVVTYPNAHNSTAGQVLTVNAAGTASWETPASSSGTAHYVGEVYGGGIVFFVWDNGAHGLIVALNEIGSKGPSDFTSTTGMYWGPVLTCGAFRSGYGAGEGNTNVMISKISNSGQQWFVYSQSVSGMYSAMAAQQYNSSYGDWYLPSAAELQLINANQNLLTGSGYNNTHVYWSSTETNDSYAYGLAVNGTTPWYQKTTLNWILPVRKF